MRTWNTSKNNVAECLICPHSCKLRPGQTGVCGVRKNTGDNIELMTYGVISGYAPDPIEKNHYTISSPDLKYYLLAPMVVI